MTTEKIWAERVADLAVAERLSEKLNISLLLAKMLTQRSVMHEADAQEFLWPSLKNLKEPLLFADMEKAVLRISQAIITKEKIGLFGDYDVDGVCSTAILQDFLQGLGADYAVTLPNRMTEGYGLSFLGVDRLKAAGASLLITADCGILAHEQIDYANSLGLSVIVVDHHSVGDILPNAYAVINPKRSDCSSGADYLCAAGVTFFLCMALRRHLREHDFFKTTSEPDLRDLLDLVALATVCDVVPLVKDNRSLVKAGLKILKAGGRVGLAALMDTCGVDKNKISSTNLGFHLGPRINAAGRLEDATEALRLMGSIDMQEAQDIASRLDSTNRERRLLEEETVAQACHILEAYDPQSLPVLVLHDEGWHPGVVGIVASRIAERYHRPAIIIGTKGKGSGRSIKGIDLHHMVSLASHSLMGFGGHAHAIGVTLGPSGVEKFRDDLVSVMRDQISSQTFKRVLAYDAEVVMSEVSLRMIEELSCLDPFGASNPYPVVRINHSFMRNIRRLQGGHIKGELEGKDGVLSFIGFRMDIDDDLVHSPIDVLGVLEKNEWQGKISVQLRLVDYKKSP